MLAKVITFLNIRRPMLRFLGKDVLLLMLGHALG
jgi:hypothetical protein